MLISSPWWIRRYAEMVVSVPPPRTAPAWPIPRPRPPCKNRARRCRNRNASPTPTGSTPSAPSGTTPWSTSCAPKSGSSALISARDWLTVFRLAPYAQRAEPGGTGRVEHQKSLVNLTKHDISQLTVLVKTRLRRMQDRPGLLEGFLAKTHLDLAPLQ
jgi:hypothetical protein